MITNIKYWFKKLFLIKEIKSQLGELHFQRYRIIETKWFNIYVHYIAKSDEDKHMHDHPWDFISIILWGGYAEILKKVWWKTTNEIEKIEYNVKTYKPISIIHRPANDFHQITLLKPTFTLVFTGPRKRTWGYLTVSDWTGYKWIDNVTYRNMKHGSTNVKNNINNINNTDTPSSTIRT